MDYDFSRLSTRSFEQLVQALAASIFGPGIVVFGDGPDGGREATFDGRIPFPDLENPWHGYGVVQAKFRQRSSDSANDGTWALGELRKDLDKFLDSKRGLRKPEYYLFATNAVLTPVAEKGGKDKAAALIERYRARLGLKGYRIWDHDQICVLLDTQESVRTAYTAWITPGDVLAAVLAKMKPGLRDFRSTMLNFVQKELRSEQYVNLGQAGHNPQDRIPLARVFVDLCVGNTDQENIPSAAHKGYENELDTVRSRSCGAISELLMLSTQRLDPLSNPSSATTTEKPERSTTPGRVVYIGGPGQGKSTLTQFFCQMHRVALLSEERSSVLLPDTIDTCELIRHQCSCESLSLPSLARFPIRVELNRFAAELADSRTASLFSYLLQRIRLRSERDDLSSDDLRKWLASYPWLLALDGLDEVPASSNRSQVLEAIQDFLIDAQQCNADLLLIATSRPQGYNDDFSPRYYLHRNLLPLDIPRAMYYAERLIDQRWGEDSEKIMRLLERLKRASAEEATARLMRSPLQVTIMALLVESLGEPPKERWRLFSEYYQVINRREKERDIPAAKLLNTYQADIDVIHQKVGVRLQIESESSGGTEALLPMPHFAELVEDRLTNEGHTGLERDRLKAEIIDAALQRLVFLVAPREGGIGFEIRSLQEFMAAQYLMNGSDEEVRQRLRAIASAAHWRNVFLFAAGRCFHDKQYLRDSLYTLCCELNEENSNSVSGTLEKHTLAGSQLALDILEDGAVASQPAQNKLYFRLALRLFELPPCPAQLRLARLYTPYYEEMLRPEIERWLTGNPLHSRLGAWKVLLDLVGQDFAWARDVADGKWPSSPETVLEIIEASQGVEIGDWLSLRCCEAVVKLPPEKFPFHWRHSPHTLSLEKIQVKAPAGLRAIFERLYGNNTYPEMSVESHLDGVGEAFSYYQYAVSDSDSIQEIEPIQDAHPILEWCRNAYNFDSSPSKDRLADLLIALSRLEDHRWLLRDSSWNWNLCWPLRACVFAAATKEDLERFANSARNGDMGDFSDWCEAERRWDNEMLTLADLQHVPRGGLPFDKDVVQVGYPLGSAGSSASHTEELPQAVRGLCKYWRALPSGSIRSEVAGSISFLVSICGEQCYGLGFEDAEIGDLFSILKESKGRWLRLGFLSALPEAFWKRPDAGAMLVDICDRDRLYGFNGSNSIVANVESLVARNPEQGVLLHLLAALYAGGHKPQCAGLSKEPDLFTCDRFFTAMILVKVAQSTWTESEASELAIKLTTQAKTSPDVIQDALAIIQGKNANTQAADAFLSTLYTRTRIEDWSTRSKILQAMQENQRRHLSDAQTLAK